MSLYLLEYEHAYQNIKVSGHVVLTEYEHKQFLDAIDKLDKDEIDFDFYINDSDNISYYSKNEILYTIDIKEITDRDYKMLKRLNLLYKGYARSFSQAIHAYTTGKEYNEDQDITIDDNDDDIFDDDDLVDSGTVWGEVTL